MPINNLLIILAIYLFLVVAPIIYFIGQTVPLTMNLMNPEKRTAKIGGDVLFISTLGSFFGALLTGLVLMEFIGVAWTVFISFFVLITLALFFSKTNKKLFIYIILIISLGWVVYKLNISFEKDHFITTTNYANYNVIKNVELVQNQKGDILLSNNSYSSFINEEKEAFPYIEFIRNILFKSLGLHNAQILVLGAGGFTLSAKGAYGNHFTYVDIDQKIKSIVEKNFLEKINGDFVAQDARTYLTKHPKQYDVVVSDAYSNTNSIPVALLTREYFYSIKNALKPNGFAVFNVISKPFLNDSYSKRVDSTIRDVFGNCMAMPLSYQNKLANVVYMCNISKNEHDKAIYTDNHNTADLDFVFLSPGGHSEYLFRGFYKKLEDGENKKYHK